LSNEIIKTNTSKTTTQKRTYTKKSNSSKLKSSTPIEPIVDPNVKVLNFAALSRLVLRDLTKQKKNPTFYKYTKDQISEFIKDPVRNEKSIRDAIVYLYGASSHFRRLIQYLAGLNYFYYIISPRNLDPTTAKPDTIREQFQKTLKLVDSIDIQTQGVDILTVCLREDVYYGTIWATNDSITIQQLPSDYCTISTIEGNVPNVSFDFAYFDIYSDYLPLYPSEFQTKYNQYQSNRSTLRWQELSSPNSFAIKACSEILAYPLPPFAGILEDIYNIVDYKALQLTKTELENYAMLIIKLAKDKTGEWELDFDKALEYWQSIDSQLPEQIGSALVPMAVEKISFDKSGSVEDDKIAKAESAFYSDAGVSSQIFNSDNTSSNALLQSIKADQAMVYNIVLKIQNAVNRFLLSQSYSKNFKLEILDISRFNQKEMIEEYYKGIMVGAPDISKYCAAKGTSQNAMIGLNYLEQVVLELPSKFIPLQSAHTLSAGGKGGRPESDPDDLGDAGEKTRDGSGNER
jgi:hypothetical protein